MTIKQQGGVFGRNPSFNDTETNDLVVNDKLGVGAGTPAANAKAHISRASSGASVLSNTTLALESTGDVILDMLSPATGRALIVFGNASSSQRGDLLYDHNADTLRVRVANATQATFNTSGLAFPSGKGIDFSATSGTGTSELFDDYEEGTWTPVYATTGTDFDSVTYDPLTAGRYIKIGNMVHISGYIRTDALDATSATGTVVVSGLPFATAVVNSDTKSMGAIATSRALNFNGMSGYPFLHPRSGFSYMYLLDGDRIDVPVAEMNTGANTNIIAFAGTYTTE